MPAPDLSGKRTILKSGESISPQMCSIESPTNSVTNFWARRKKVQAKEVHAGDTDD